MMSSTRSAALSLSKRRLLGAARRDTAVFARVWRRGIVPGPQQYEMARRFDDDSIQYQADFWPRDHGKSEVFCLSGPLRRICEDPNIRILIVQKTATEAEKTLSVVKYELEHNDELKRYYAHHWQAIVGVPDICNAMGSVVLGRKKEGAWQQRRIYVRRTRRGKDPTVEAVGVGGAITGGHFDLIILDDVEDDENTKTDDRVSSIVNWFTGTIMQLREPHTKIIVVGTLKTMKPDIYSLVQKNPVWSVVIRSAITSHRLDQLEYEPIRNEEGRVVDVEVRTPNVQTLWPAKWPIKALLLEMYASPRRSVWIREKLNDLRALAGRLFKAEWFGYAELAEIPRPFRRKIQVWDTAFGEEGSNWSVCATLILAADNRVYVTRIYRARLEFPELVRAMRREFERERPERVLVEDKASGRSAIQTLIRESGVPVVAVSPGGRDKTTRAEAITPFYEAGRIRHLAGAEWIDGLEDELVMFPDGEFDDQVDALTYGVRELMLTRRSVEVGASPVEGYRG